MTVVRQVCPLCGRDDEVGFSLNADGEPLSVTCTCIDPNHEPYSWTPKTVPALTGNHRAGRSGIMAQLGLFDDLLACLDAGGPWIEHGVVEHRYLSRRPDVYYGTLLPNYGHAAIVPNRYSTSSLLSQALAQLWCEGLVCQAVSPATGFWSYNGKMSAWALPPAPTLDELLCWDEFALENGLDPDVWPVILL